MCIRDSHHDDAAQQVRHDVVIPCIGLHQAGGQPCGAGQPPPEHPEHPLMGAHIGQLVRHMVLHQICLLYTSTQAGIIGDGGQTAGLADRFSLDEGIFCKGSARLVRLDGDAPVSYTHLRQKTR